MADDLRLNIVLTEEGGQAGGQPAAPPARVPAPAGATPAQQTQAGPAVPPAVPAPAGQQPAARPAQAGQVGTSALPRQAGGNMAAGPAGSAGESKPAGGLSDALKAGSPALAAVETAGKMLATAFDATRKGVEMMGKTAADLARNDHMAIFNRTVDGASEALSKVPIVGEALGSAFQAAAAPVRAFTEAVGAFVQRGEQLAGFSADIAGARAEAEVRTIQSDIREAQELGPAIARLTESSNAAWIELREILLPMKRAIVEILATGMEGIAGLAESARDRLKSIVGVLEDFFDLMRARNPLFWLGGIGDRIVNLLESIRLSLDRDTATPDTLEMLYGIADGFDVPPDAGPAPGVPGGGRMGLPAFGGVP